MIASYAFRLICLCMASFFLVHVVLGMAISLLAPVLLRRAEHLRARRSARLLLAARLFPATLAAILVVGLCIPSFLWREPEAGMEEVGLVCLALAALGLAIVTISIVRTARAAFGSAGYGRRARRMGRPARLAGCRSRVWIVDAPRPFVSLAGILHPRIVVSRAVVEGLPPEQLAAALRHEQAHRASRDNLKRLLILMAPGMLPLGHGFRRLDRGWARFTEWAADDDAVAGSSRRSLSLAAALVRVARMGAGPRPEPLVTSLLADGQDLSARIDRLLRAAPPREVRRRRIPVLRAAASMLLGGAALAVMLRPATLDAVHGLLEELVH